MALSYEDTIRVMGALNKIESKLDRIIKELEQEDDDIEIKK